jgi:hypothetical protein
VTSPVPRSRALRVTASVLWFAAIAGFALWSRRPLVREGLWTDEAISVYVARAPSAGELLFRNRTSDYTPPLFNVLLAGFTRIAGSGESSLKSYALIWGFLAAAAGVALAAELGGLLASAIAAAFLVNNPILIEMSAELRAYSLSALLAGASLLAVFRLRRAAAGVLAWTLATLLLVLLVWSHVAGGILALVLFVWGLVEWRAFPQRPFGRRLAVSAGLAGMTFLVWLPTTWRQAKIGLPWEKKLPPAEFFRAFQARTREMLPIPQGFEHPVFGIGLALLFVAAFFVGRRAAAEVARDGRPLAVTAIAGAAIWLVLGLYTGQSSRYLIVPATLFSAVLAAVLARLMRAAAAATPRARMLAVSGIACLVVSAFVARADFYEARFATARRPKSGLRGFCASPAFPADGIVLVAPDYLAPTAWYYCDQRDRLRGFTHWERPFLFDPARYRELWGDPGAAEAAVAKIEEALAAGQGRRFVLVQDDPPTQLLPLFEGPVQGLDAALAARFDERPLGRYPGRVESVRAVELRRR